MMDGLQQTREPYPSASTCGGFGPTRILPRPRPHLAALTDLGYGCPPVRTIRSWSLLRPILGFVWLTYRGCGGSNRFRLLLDTLLDFVLLTHLCCTSFLFAL